MKSAHANEKSIPGFYARTLVQMEIRYNASDTSAVQATRLVHSRSSFFNEMKGCRDVRRYRRESNHVPTASFLASEKQ